MRTVNNEVLLSRPHSSGWARLVYVAIGVAMNRHSSWEQVLSKGVPELSNKLKYGAGNLQIIIHKVGELRALDQSSSTLRLTVIHFRIAVNVTKNNLDFHLPISKYQVHSFWLYILKMFLIIYLHRSLRWERWKIYTLMNIEIWFQQLSIIQKTFLLYRSDIKPIKKVKNDYWT